MFNNSRYLNDPCGIFCIIFVYFTIIYSNYSYLAYLIFTNINLFKCILALFYQIVVLFVLWTHSKACYCDPGIIQRPAHNLDFSGDRLLDENNLDDLNKTNNWSICTKCETYRPPKAYHCQICQSCISKMDHHCPWINNCVGELNQKYFLQFLFYVGFLCIITLITIFFEFLKIKNQKQDHVKIVHCIILLIESLLFGIFVIAIFTDQVQVLRNNDSSTDNFKNVRRKKYQLSKKSFLKEIFGKGPFIFWLLPLNTKKNRRFDQFVI